MLQTIIQCQVLRPVHNMMLYVSCIVRVTFASMLVPMQRDARIDSDSILMFLCIAFWHLITKKLLNLNFRVSQTNLMQDAASYCEPAFIIVLQLI